LLLIILPFTLVPVVIEHSPAWLILVVIPLLFAWFFFTAQWTWKIYNKLHASPLPPSSTPEQEWEARFQKIADSTDDLPQGLTLASFCQEYDESVLKQAMHILHRTPPGSRHLRVALQELL